MSINYHYLFKFIIVGYPSTGKTSILARFLKPLEKWTDYYEPTLGLEFGSRVLDVDGSLVKVMAWDTAGQQTFRSLIRSYYKGAIVCLLVFDITSRNSMNAICEWLAEVRKNSHDHIKIYLIGNKLDIENNRNVSVEEAEQFVKEHSLCRYEQVSAKEGLNIEQLFLTICRDIINDLYEGHLELTPDSNIGIKIGTSQQSQSNSIKIEKRPQQTSQCEC